MSFYGRLWLVMFQHLIQLLQMLVVNKTAPIDDVLCCPECCGWGSRMAAPLPQISCSVGQLWNWVLVVSESPLLHLFSQETSRASVYLQSGGKGGWGRGSLIQFIPGDSDSFFFYFQGSMWLNTWTSCDSSTTGHGFTWRGWVTLSFCISTNLQAQSLGTWPSLLTPLP